MHLATTRGATRSRNASRTASCRLGEHRHHLSLPRRRRRSGPGRCPHPAPASRASCSVTDARQPRRMDLERQGHSRPRLLLYRLPGLRASGDATVWITEGEKDADRLHDEGLIATTDIGGAGKWRDEYAGVPRQALRRPAGQRQGRTRPRRHGCALAVRYRCIGEGAAAARPAGEGRCLRLAR